MKELKLLIVEDDQTDQTDWGDSIGVFNKSIKDDGLEITVRFCDSFEDANSLISNDFDAVIIDLRLMGDDKSSMDTGGGKLIKERIDKLRLPTFVYTATPALIDEIQKEETVFFKKYVKAEHRMADILEEIKKIYDTGITRILGGRGKIEDFLNKIFWKHLSHSLDHWMESLGDSDAEKALLRYISAHLSEYLAIDQDGHGHFDKFFAPEFYIKPPIGDHPYTGDILKKIEGNDYYVILNPSCDMVLRPQKDLKTPPERKAAKIVLASIIPWEKVPELSGIPGNVSNSNRKKLTPYVSNNTLRYHYLPFYVDIGKMFIDFESIESIDPGLVDGNHYERVATISPAFLRNIIARFSQFYSRQGQPDFDVDHQLNLLLPKK